MTIRTISEVLDSTAGNIIRADEFFARPEHIVMPERRKLQECISSGEKYLICSFCGQTVVIRGRTNGKNIIHFAHLKDSDDCPIKTDNKYTKDELLLMQYERIRETERHKRIKSLIQESLKCDQSFSDIKNKSFLKSDNNQRKQPDISAIYLGYQLAIEAQLSTTFIKVLVERDLYYKSNKTFILWVFDDRYDECFEKMSEKDVI